MAHEHFFRGKLLWTGAQLGPAARYESYSREWTFQQQGVADLVGTAAVAYRGVADRRNPEDLLLAAVSACHCLSFLAEAVRAHLTVLAYHDTCEAKMSFKDKKMRIVQANLRPVVTLAGGDIAAVQRLHEQAHAGCFIASSVNFPIYIESQTIIDAE